MDNKIECGRCKSKWDPQAYQNLTDVNSQNSVISCPVCGFSRKDINESRDNRKILKG